MIRATLRVAWVAILLVATARAADDADTAFELKVRPVLANSCVKCHGPTKASGGLRVDSREALLKGGEHGPAIAPGDPGKSLLIQAVRYEHDDVAMPPEEPLDDGAVADLAAWVESGAAWPATSAASGFDGTGSHWAFAPVRAVEPPADPSGWAETAIDRFLAAKQREHGVAPVGPADRRALIRRATFDLTGLPPTPEDVEAFVGDPEPTGEAFARVVDRLLADPAYGERWGRFWLDLARYADTAGDNSDYPIPEAYLYRDYVIDAFNADVPYDQFLTEQLAGDILARSGPRDDYARRVIATGFLAQAKRFGTHKLEDMHQIVEDILQTTGQVALGLTLRCARCHDHKYDPITAADYYAMYGVFAGAAYPFAGSEELRRPEDFAPLVHPDELAPQEAEHQKLIDAAKAALAKAEAEHEAAGRVRELEPKVAALEEEAKGAESDRREAIEKDLAAQKDELKAAREALAEAVKPLKAEVERLEADRPSKRAPAAYAVREGTPSDVAIQRNGDPRNKGPVVPRGVPAFLEADPKLDIPEGSSGRLELARWLTKPENPLTARVMVNRIWQQHFGKAIVPTPSDFGLRGEPPTHPELLDWLAGEFVRGGWSIKAMHRTIMGSKAYQLAAAADPANAGKDAGNRWYWRFDRRRLDAESLRDAVLDLGGTLDRTRPGPHPFPPKNKWRFTAHHQFKALYDSDHRSVYLMVQRLQPHPYLALFNGPDTSASTAVRDSSTVPLQALYLLNSPMVHEQGRKFAKSLIASSPEAAARIDLAYRRAFARPPTTAEAGRALAFVEHYTKAAEADAPADAEHEAWAALARLLLASNEFLFVD